MVALFGQVVAIDGVLMICHRRTFQALNGFDNQTFTGFHFYDIDISFRAALSGRTNWVAPIPLMHDSKGVFGAAWETNRQKFVRKFAGNLPAALKQA